LFGHGEVQAMQKPISSYSKVSAKRWKTISAKSRYISRRVVERTIVSVDAEHRSGLGK
jgi:hypothetical protein